MLLRIFSAEVIQIAAASIDPFKFFLSSAEHHLLRHKVAADLVHCKFFYDWFTLIIGHYLRLVVGSIKFTF